MATSPEPLRFLTEGQTLALQERFGTPLYVYDQETLEAQAQRALRLPAPFGLTVRYAMKACPSAGVLRVLTRAGLQVDASSGWEARRALAAGVPAGHILLTAQQLPDDLDELTAAGVRFNACSLDQLAAYGERFPGAEVAVRLNPGLGSGHSNRTNVGGPSSSFGIWHTHLEPLLEAARARGLRITLLHTHIGSGSDPGVWQHCARLTLNLARHLPDVTAVNLGGGYKIGRMSGESSTDLLRAAAPIVDELRRFADDSGRRLRLEIEPGTFLAGNAGAVVASVIDVVDTGKEGFSFIKTDTGMTEILRPSMYGAQHPVTVVPRGGRRSTATGVSRRRPLLRERRCSDSGPGGPRVPAGAHPRPGAGRRRRRHRRRRRLLRGHVGQELQLLPGGARGVAGRGRRFPPAAEAADAGADDGERVHSRLSPLIRGFVPPGAWGLYSAA